ncbi:fluoride efflux transporter FluC [Bifidobacterium biavatii]|uniref:Fluoride-specific ion channel FluC n=1 Tax=Bifidobacterium biavatii DSM 23969 TaxID=1437608 RepID=A0A086ZNE8_9BIFI|nr:CrcB family protein [Bifidobacterium biavatii]KFI48048.1 camphor resistance protein CrcB [Bifidobacterium biavatii DSM 23969]
MSEEDVPSLELPILNTAVPPKLSDIPLPPDAATAVDDAAVAHAVGDADVADDVDAVLTGSASSVSSVSSVAEVAQNSAAHDDVANDDDAEGTTSLASDGVVPTVASVDVASDASGDASAEPLAPPATPLAKLASNDIDPPTMEMSAAKINAASGRPIAALLGEGQPAPPKIPLAPMKRMQARFNPLADGMIYLVVFLGGFVGTGLRYGLNLALPNPIAAGGFFSAFHPSTFIANMCACFIFAALSAYMSQASWIRKRARELTSRGVGMGMCGGFSTLSAMAIEDLTSLQASEIGGFAFYTLLSFACGLFVAWGGTMLALHAAEKHSRKAIHDAIDRGDGANVARSQAPAGDYGQPVARDGVRTAVSSNGAAANGQSAASHDGNGNAAQSGGPTVVRADGTTVQLDALTASKLVPSFEPDPVTDEIPMVADPLRGEAREQ